MDRNVKMTRYDYGQYIGIIRTDREFRNFLPLRAYFQ